MNVALKEQMMGHSILNTSTVFVLCFLCGAFTHKMGFACVEGIRVSSEKCCSSHRCVHVEDNFFVICYKKYYRMISSTVLAFLALVIKSANIVQE